MGKLDPISKVWAVPNPELLTEAEHKAISLAADIYNLLCQEIIPNGNAAYEDLSELVSHVHAIQSRIMAQAAARAYPSLYRLLGSSLGPIGDDSPPA